ncbi:hypothetical protein ACGTN6_18435 [Halomonas sp. THAF12]
MTLGYDVTERYRQANDDYATLCGERVFSRTWNETLPRDHL